MWISHLPDAVFAGEWKARASVSVLLKLLEEKPNPRALGAALDAALNELRGALPKQEMWKWSAAHSLQLRHPLNTKTLNLPVVARPGDANTVHASGGTGGASGASYREIIDVADWDRSVMTNTPGESGDPASKHYRDLLDDWAAGRYHPMPFSRKAVEAALDEKIVLEPR
jgi:penicillin amidase